MTQCLSLINLKMISKFKYWFLCDIVNSPEEQPSQEGSKDADVHVVKCEGYEENFKALLNTLQLSPRHQSSTEKKPGLSVHPDEKLSRSRSQDPKGSKHVLFHLNLMWRSIYNNWINYLFLTLNYLSDLSDSFPTLYC